LTENSDITLGGLTLHDVHDIENMLVIYRSLNLDWLRRQRWKRCKPDSRKAGERDTRRRHDEEIDGLLEKLNRIGHLLAAREREQGKKRSGAALDRETRPHDGPQ
jgi:hypothetical protein